jgi:CubicO group peptidase (beta-lactamase class C family)
MRRLICCLLAILSIACNPSLAGQSDAFERITPQQAGYSAERLAELPGFLEQAGSDSLLLLHNGKVFFEWGDIRKRLLIHSMRKALLNSLYGIYQARGNIDVNQTLAELGIDDLPPALSAQEKSAQLIDLLKSRSGVYHPAAAESDGMSQSRPARGSHAPGEFFYYNNWDFNVVGRVLEQRIGRRVYDAFHEEIAQPLGMLDYHNRIVVAPDGELTAGPEVDGFYKYERDRSHYPAYHFRMSAHDLALYGQLYLNRGRWQDRQLVPADWIALSTRPYSITEPQYGIAYGMLWDVLVPDSPDEAPSFYHTGAGVHMLAVYPKHGLVMVHRVDTENGSRFNDGDLYRVIRMVHGARLPKPQPEAPASQAK